MSAHFSAHAIEGVPMIEPGDALAQMFLDAISANGLALEDGDILVVAQKVVSKAEGRYVRLDSVAAGEEAVRIANVTGKDARLVEIILRESTQVVRMKPGVLIVRHKLGWVCAQGGVDQSNIDHADGERALLLPENPDASANRVRHQLYELTKVHVGVIICDSMNRPWRLGSVGVAIGAAGIAVLEDHRGGHDLYGRDLQVTLISRADAIASAANLVMGETTAKVPLALVRGLRHGMDQAGRNDSALDIIRPVKEDMFL
ncbi:MAG: coenzyme F420-0:L-glutamate ligase [Gammaproteobacteria bacterium]|nr:coenzyme F420-0:L-glutamate ligase [Gammaproteobacteria bacterium]